MASFCPPAEQQVLYHTTISRNLIRGSGYKDEQMASTCGPVTVSFPTSDSARLDALFLRVGMSGSSTDGAGAVLCASGCQ
jgi:hypothetical protein